MGYWEPVPHSLFAFWRPWGEQPLPLHISTMICIVYVLFQHGPPTVTGSTKDGVQSETMSESKLFLHVSSLSQQWKANTTEAHIFFHSFNIDFGSYDWLYMVVVSVSEGYLSIRIGTQVHFRQTSGEFAKRGFSEMFPIWQSPCPTLLWEWNISMSAPQSKKEKKCCRLGQKSRIETLKGLPTCPQVHCVLQIR